MGCFNHPPIKVYSLVRPCPKELTVKVSPNLNKLNETRDKTNNFYLSAPWAFGNVLPLPGGLLCVRFKLRFKIGRT